MHALVHFWKDLDVTTAPYLHPEDRGLITDYATLDYHRYQERFGEIHDSTIHAGLLPRPYFGDLSRADVFILMLNPGFKPIDYYSEGRDRAFRACIIKELRQDLADTEFPFGLLNPSFCFHAGFAYWHGRLRKLCETVAERQHIGHRDALRILSRRLAVVQLFPYHSRTFRHHRLLKRLPSVALARDFGKRLRARAEREEVTVVVVRAVREWGFLAEHESRNVVIYQGPETRGGYINDRAVKAILDRW